MRSFTYRLSGILLGLTCLAVTGAGVAEERPNVVLLMAEDMGLDLACYGMRGVATPTLDRMAREGRKYENAFCANPICSPNRSAMMVGVNQTLINAHMHRSNRDVPLAAPYRPVTALLREAGYTCLLGHDRVMDRGTKIDCNFQHAAKGPWDGVEQFGLFDDVRSFKADDAPFFAQIQLKVTHRGDWWNGVRRASEHPVAVEAVELPPYIPNTPKTRLDWATYLDTVEFMDGEVAMIEEELRDKGLLDSTIIIFVGDNGRCNIRGKGYLHEPGIRVPLIIWGPRRWVEPAVVESLVSVLDITATVLHLAGVKLPEYMEAGPLVGTEMPHTREYVYSARDGWDEVNECIRSVSTQRYSYIRNYMPELPYDRHQAYLDFMRPAIHEMRRLKAEGRLSGDEAIFLAEHKAPEELYDLVADPHELVNLADDPDHAETLRRMRDLMDQWQATHHDLGLVDYRTRATEPSSAGKTRAWLLEHRPDVWQHYLDGEIGDGYQKWSQTASGKKKPK